MEIMAYLGKVAYLGPSEIIGDKGRVYYSRFDNSYLTRAGMADDIKFLADLEITHELSSGLGFSPRDNKWYGWSHRAVYGFTIGSTCKKGDCHYRPVDKDDFLNDMVRFWDDDHRLNTRGHHTEQDGEKGVYIEWEYGNEILNEKMRSQIHGTFIQYPDAWGKGEWIAKTMEDAKQMAIDFRDGVS